MNFNIKTNVFEQMFVIKKEETTTFLENCGFSITKLFSFISFSKFVRFSSMPDRANTKFAR